MPVQIFVDLLCSYVNFDRSQIYSEYLWCKKLAPTLYIVHILYIYDLHV